MEKRLYNATKNGEKNELLCLLHEDAQLLDRFTKGRYPETPLHIAVMLGHSEFTDELLIRMASLLADMAFHAAVNTPGGVWHDSDPSHRAGHSVFADTYPNTYTQFLMSNTFGFMASLIIIQLLISGLPIQRKLFKRVLIAVMSVAIAAMGFVYAVSLVPLTSDPAYSWLFIRFWTIFMILLLTAWAVQLMIKIFKFGGFFDGFQCNQHINQQRFYPKMEN
ncbi:hypothetical protein CXB51_015113 [Gossypium anomalum]|uniref:PGG domain-containing protein n=1 Tax=Gossypium anomalum TaxID=47600 RepID=A0A8J5YSB3_9ROSI|nr:hypothetical protein CXB51_015113 [Gossypium anomalum]